MADVQRVRIKALYGEIAGILNQLPLAEKSFIIPQQIGMSYNSAVDELSKIADINYERHKLTSADVAPHRRDSFQTSIVRTKVGSLVKRLEEEHSFGNPSSGTGPILNISNMNQMHVTIIDIDQLIEQVHDIETKDVLEEIKTATAEKDESKLKGLLKKLMDRSWEVFIQSLPWILDQLSKRTG